MLAIATAVLDQGSYGSTLPSSLTKIKKQQQQQQQQNKQVNWVLSGQQNLVKNRKWQAKTD